MSASLDLSAPRLGSGTRFRKLSAHLASRGASNPDALAAFIGRKKFGKLSAQTLANPDLGIYLAETAKDEQGLTLTCPECSYSGPANSFGPGGASLQKQPDDLRTPARGNVQSRAGFEPGSSGVQPNAAHALANAAGGTLEVVVGQRREEGLGQPFVEESTDANRE